MFGIFERQYNTNLQYLYGILLCIQQNRVLFQRKRCCAPSVQNEQFQRWRVQYGNPRYHQYH